MATIPRTRVPVPRDQETRGCCRFSHRSGGEQIRCLENASEGAFASMNNRRNSYLGLLLAAVLSATIFGGCRAFEPEAVIVNKAPETFIIGAPLEDGGGYYHFHVFWYGSDSDGQVERFVWALTDTTIQDDDTVNDEEDQNFNPALDASTLEIAHWTTRTDSIFNFTINQGVKPSVNMTLHMVAIDDLGDYDRTPARLHFFSNTLGNPTLQFVELLGDDLPPRPLVPGVPDTVGFGRAYHVGWEGATPNLRGYSSDALAAVDTVFPYDDGLFGYKYRILGELGGNCLPSQEDCWLPRRFNEATGDSFSFFGSTTSLLFANNGSGESPFLKQLPSGAVDIQVNSIDIAGVEVAEYLRPFSFIVNYDPQTVMLRGESDPTHPGADNDQAYPYYTLLNDTNDPKIKYVFSDQDGAPRIPDRSYVTFKALVRDHPEDVQLPAAEAPYKIAISGFMKGVRQNFSGGLFAFSTESSELNTDPQWGTPDGCDDCWSADTLGFLTAPRTRFTMSMQAVDQHGRREGVPAKMDFDVGYPPCVQCVELLPKSDSVSQVPVDVHCAGDYDEENPGAVDFDPAFVFDSPAVHECFDNVTDLQVIQSPVPSDGYLEKLPVALQAMLVDRSTYFVRIGTFVGNPADRDPNLFYIPVDIYQMSMLLHGVDDPRERWPEKVRRMMAWQYQVDYECDPFNQIKDGGGSDDIKEVTWGEPTGLVTTGLSIDTSSGLWRVDVEVPVPTPLFAGEVGYRAYLLNVVAAGDPEVADELFLATTTQFGAGTVRVVAVDQTTCGSLPTRPAKYTFFRHVSLPQELAPPASWRDCNLLVPDIKASLALSRGAMASETGVPIVKSFRLSVITTTGELGKTCDLNKIQW